MITISVTPDKTLRQFFQELTQINDNTDTITNAKICYKNEKEYTIIAEITSENGIKINFEEYDKKTLQLKPKTVTIDKIIISFKPSEKTISIVTDNKEIQMAKDFFYIDYYDNTFWIGEYYAHSFTYKEFVNKKSKIKTYTKSS
jgi:hypothetical protein